MAKRKRVAARLRVVEALEPLRSPRDGGLLAFSVRTATAGDLKFIDSLQKRFSNEVGFLPLCALEGHMSKGRVSIGFENDEPAGYILVQASYRRDAEQAILYQCAIEYSARRHLLGSALLEHALGLCPSGTRLASAWVAQDIDANLFWEACGFEPIAARRGSKRKGRVHIFWQRRIDRSDTRLRLRSPSETSGGLMRDRRLVIAIDTSNDDWKHLRPEDLPDVEAEAGSGGASHREARPGRLRVSLAEARKDFVYGASEWMWVIINGAGRYLPVVEEIEVPAFMDLPTIAVAAHPSVPASRIPGVGMSAA